MFSTNVIAITTAVWKNKISLSEFEYFIRNKLAFKTSLR